MRKRRREITVGQILNLQQELFRAGKDIEDVLTEYGLDSVKEITEAVFNDVMRDLTGGRPSVA